MTETNTAQALDQPLIYQVRLKGHLGQPWGDWFNQVTIEQEAEGVTCLMCTVPDQAALHGLLKKVRDIGAPLISVICLNPEHAKTLAKHT